MSINFGDQYLEAIRLTLVIVDVLLELLLEADASLFSHSLSLSNKKHSTLAKINTAVSCCRLSLREQGSETELNGVIRASGATYRQPGSC